MATSNIRIKKMCEWCGNEFEAQKCSTRYCSKRCAEHAYKERKRQEKKKRVENHEIERVAAEGEDKLRGCFIISVKAQAKKFEMDLYLSRRSIAVAM